MTQIRGVGRRIDHLGRVVIPVEIRRAFGIRPGDEVDISVNADSDGIVLRKVEAACVFCKATESLTEHQGKLVCATCRAEIAATLPVSS